MAEDQIIEIVVDTAAYVIEVDQEENVIIEVLETGPQGPRGTGAAADPSARLTALGIAISETQPAGMVTYLEWLTTGQGVWCWFQTTAPEGVVTALLTAAKATGVAGGITAQASRFIIDTLGKASATGAAAALSGINAAAVTETLATAQGTAAVIAIVATAAKMINATLSTATAIGAVTSIQGTYAAYIISTLAAASATSVVAGITAYAGSAEAAMGILGTASGNVAAVPITAIVTATSSLGPATATGAISSVVATAVRYMTGTLGTSQATAAAIGLTGAASSYVATSLSTATAAGQTISITATASRTVTNTLGAARATGSVVGLTGAATQTTVGTLGKASAIGAVVPVTGVVTFPAVTYTETFTPAFSGFPYTGDAGVWNYSSSDGTAPSVSVHVGRISLSLSASGSTQEAYITFNAQSQGVLTVVYSGDSSDGGGGNKVEILRNGVVIDISGVPNTYSEWYTYDIPYPAGNNTFTFRVTEDTGDGLTAIFYDTLTWTPS